MEKRELYDIIEDFDTLRVELAYFLKSNKCFIEVEIADIYVDRSEALSLLSGIESTQEKLLTRFEILSDELTEIMKAQKNANS